MHWSYSGEVTQQTGDGDTTTAENDVPYNGDFGGFLYFKIHWDDHTKTTFRSTCLTEVGSKRDDGASVSDRSLQVEVEGEGWVKGFPGDPANDSRKAVAKIELKRERGTKPIEIKIALRLGDHCNEVSGGSDGDVEFGFKAGQQQSEPPGIDDFGDDDFTGVEETGWTKGQYKSVDVTSGAYNNPFCGVATSNTDPDFGPDHQD